MILTSILNLFRPPSGDDGVAPGPEILFSELERARPGADYTSLDRLADFRTVFLGSDAGKRVLYEILAWSRMFASSFVPGDSHATHWREGGRDVGLRILQAFSARPPDPFSGSGMAAEADDGEETRP